MRKNLLFLIMALMFGIIVAGCGIKPNADTNINQNEKIFNPQETEAGKVIQPLVSLVDFDNMQGKYYCTINSVENLENGTIIGDFGIYTMDLYDAVDIATLEKGDTVIVRGKDILVDYVEEGNPIDMSYHGDKEGGLKSVYIINGGIEEGGAAFIDNDGGTFRYFGMDDYATYTKSGNVKLPISEDAVIVDHRHDFDLAEYTEEGVTVKAADFSQYFKDDMYDGVSNFTEFDTSILVENGVVTGITRVFTP